MAREIKADNDTWTARLGEGLTEPGERTVLFFCKTTDQRPYRVATVEEERVARDPELRRLSERELRELFEASQSMGRTTGRAVEG